MNQSKENITPVLGCAFFLFSGTIIGGLWIVLILLSGFNWWLLSYSVIFSVYILQYSKYIFIKPTKDSFYLGRQLCFLTFPAFSNILFLILWYQTNNWAVTVLISLIVGWLISIGLQRTLFAHEYTFRDDPDNRINIDSNNIDPVQSHELNLEGVVLAKKGSFKEAQLKFERAIELSPDNPDPRISISNILIHDGRYTEAENQLKRALLLKPSKLNEQNIYNNLANLYASKKKFSEALNYYKKSIAVHKPDYDIYLNLALCSEQLGEWDEALKYFKFSNKGLINRKAQLGLVRVQQSMHKSPEMESILNAYQGVDHYFPECGSYSLSQEEIKTIEILNDSSLVFFIGAGISFPYPSCLLKASDILNIIFHFYYELDKNELSDILQAANEKEAYERLCCDLAGVTYDTSLNNIYTLPFEPTFQALYDSFGFPVIRFVDLLSIGLPNLHHQMLAEALKKGHTVITTNFDQKIEGALNGEAIKILITDKDFQYAIDNSLYDGVLAKIHGDISDYGSLALTMSEVAAGSDKSMCIGDDIDEKKAKEQSYQIYPGTFLSIPKALWLQNVLKQKKICVMGYSGSDVADIMPILTNLEYNCRGLWVEYDCKLPKSVELWAKVGRDREVLKPENETEIKYDVPSKVSKYLLGQFGNSSVLDGNEKFDLSIINSSIISWIDRLRLRPGDGLVFCARLYSQRGLWHKAELLYSRAMLKYEKDLYSNELRWLISKSNKGYIIDHLEREDETIRISNEIRNYMEENNKQDLYPHLYANTLIEIAGKYVNTDKDYEAGLLVDKAMKIAEEIDDKQILCFGLRIAADRYFDKKDYKNALDLYLSVYKLTSDVFGDSRESCLSSMAAALCFAHLGQQYEALQMIAIAERYATFLGDKDLIEQTQHNGGYISTLFIGKSPALPIHEEFIAKAKIQIGKNNEKEIDELMEYIQSGMYNQCLIMIDRLLHKYDHIDIKSYLLFVKSNIYHRGQKTNEEIEALLELDKLKPEFPIVEHNLGNAYSILKQYDIAEKHFLKSIELLEGNYPLAHCNLGIMYANMLRKSDAISQLEIAEKTGAPENSLNILRKHISEIK